MQNVCVYVYMYNLSSSLWINKKEKIFYKLIISNIMTEVTR